MRSRPEHRFVVAALSAAVVILAALPAGASADLFAITEVRGANGHTDLARFDVGTGARQTLPSSVNTAADEVHPSLSPDGKRLAYESVTASTSSGTNRIVVVDLGTGTSADLINAFDTVSVRPNDPDWSDNGHVTIGESTGETPNPSGTFNSDGMSIDVSAFPTGPFPRTATFFGDFPNKGRTIQYERRSVSSTRALDVAGYRDFTGSGRIELRTNAGPVVLGGTASRSFDHPTLSTSDQVIVFERSNVASDGARFGTRLAFTNLSLSGVTDLPDIVSDPFAFYNGRPDFSFDGRYLGVVRIKSTSDTPHLFVWDTQTQLLVNPDGIDLGPFPGTFSLEMNDGAIAIGDPALILNSSILSSGLIAFNIASLSNIGIIVQKVVGRTRVLGRPAPRLRFIGRVPLGKFHKGHGRVRWDKRVNGKRLAPGLYQITLRSVTRSAKVRDLGRPVLVRIHRR